MLGLDVFQSMWAMELRRPDGFELSLHEKIVKISDAGFKGVSFDFGYHTFTDVKAALPLLKEHQLDLVFNAFVKDVAGYQEITNFINDQNINPRFVGIIGQIEAWNVEKVADTTGKWLDVGKQAGITTYAEIHRNCMTNDLLFTLQLMDAVPQLGMIADLSHTLVNQEWYLPLHEEANKRISQFLARTEAFHGRVATREQVQVAIEFPQHKPWFDLFQQWWKEGFSSWQARHANTHDQCVFLSELGPPVYAITGADGYELSDRWQEALLLKSTAERLWEEAKKEN